MLAEADAEVALVANHAHVLDPGLHAGHVQDDQAERPPSARVCAVVGRQVQSVAVDVDVVPDGPVHDDHGHTRCHAAHVRLDPHARVGNGLHGGDEHRHVEWQAARHDGVGCDLLHRGLAVARRDPCDDLIPGEIYGYIHGRHGFFSRWDNGGTGSPATTVKLVSNATADLDGRLCYQLILYVMLAPQVIYLSCLPFLPESPHWLLQRQKERKALQSLTGLRQGPSDEASISAEFQKMKFWEAHELEITQDVSFLGIFRKSDLRRALLSCGVVLAPTGIGAMFLLIYETYLFDIVSWCTVLT